MISTGITGTARQGTMPNRARKVLVKTLTLTAPRAFRIASRARTMCGASMLSPAIFSAKYAFTLAEMFSSPFASIGQPPCGS